MQETIDTRTTNGGPHKIAVGTGPVVIQNQGTGTIYASRSPDVSTTGPGIEVLAPAAVSGAPDKLELRGVDAPVYLTSDTDGTDVRIERF